MGSEAERFFAEADLVRRRWDVLTHPFYERWTAGDLCRDDLRLYASEYHHAVVAIAELSERVVVAAGEPLSAELVEHAAEERAHVELWLDFARAVGWGGRQAWCYAEEPLAETVACAQIWAGAGDVDSDHRLVALYSIESTSARVSMAKMAGLREHYGIRGRVATRYFRLHATRDYDHAALARRALAPRIPDADTAALLDRVEAVHRSHWKLLDGIDRLVRA